MVTTGGELFAEPDIERRELGGGGFVLASREPLGAYPDHLCHWLDHWAQQAPERVFLAERGADDAWQELSFGAARSRARGVASALLRRGLGQGDTVMILSDNSLDNAVLMFGCMYAGVPVAPVSPAYSLMSSDLGKLKQIAALLEPKVVFAADGAMFARAFDALECDAEIVVSRNAPDGREVTLFEDFATGEAGAEVDAAYAALGPDDTAKILFTSGSTGVPKGVINTHRMLCSNQQAIAQMWPFVSRRPPVAVDWLPWNHTFGANHNLNMILKNGGTLYIDGGKPVPHLIGKTIANLKEVAPTVYFNVPRGYDMLLPTLEADQAFRDNFFSRLDLLFYAAAALPQTSWQRLEALSEQVRGEKIVMTSSWGATETAPLATSAHMMLENAGVIGVPAPGTEIKFLPNGGKLEMRLRGPNVMPGYYRRDDLTAEAFDEDGFYRIGDAGLLADEADANKGIVFNGRVAEDFKLLTGTWVNVGALRVAVIGATVPVVQDAVLTGHDRDEAGALLFASPAGCAAATGLEAATPVGEMIAHPAVKRRIEDGLKAHNAGAQGSSETITRVLVMAEPPSIDANEITDKGYINQRAVLERRAEAVEKLYAASREGNEALVLIEEGV